MKIKYAIYFFTLCLMISFSLFIVDELLEAHNDYRDNQFNLYKIERAKEISEAFQASLQAHRLKRLSLIDPQITRAHCLAADRAARENIAPIRQHLDSEVSKRLGVQQKIAALSMIGLMEQLLDNDNLQLAQGNNANANLFNLNSAYYISQTSKSYYRYTYDTRIADADSFMLLESIRLNNRLNMALTELNDQIIDVNISPFERKDAYLKSIQLTGVLNALSTRLIFMKINYDDAQITDIVNQLLALVSTERLQQITHGLYTAIDTGKSYPTALISQYVNELSERSQALYQRSFELETLASRHKIYDSQTTIYGMISLAGLAVLLFILPALVFCANINRWLTKTHNNIVRLSRGEMDIDRNDAFYSRELIAISDAIQQLRQYQLDKVSLESEKQRLIKELETSSFLDPLTNIYNRRKFFLECRLLGDGSYPQAFCLIDIDNFKHLNDSYGHDVGDRVLVEFGHLLQRAFRASDIFCRYGGEEFAVLLGGCSVDNAREIMEQLRARTHRLALNLADGRQVRFTISCGIAPVNAFSALQGAIKRADEALYFCKNNGKDRVSAHTQAGFI